MINFSDRTGPGVFYNGINTVKVVGSFNDIIHIYCTFFNPYGIHFKDIPCLVVGQPVPLNMIGIVGKINLDFVVNAAAKFQCFLLTQDIQQGICPL